MTTITYRPIFVYFAVLCAVFLSGCDFNLGKSFPQQRGPSTHVVPDASDLIYDPDVLNSKLAPPKGFVSKSLFSESLSDNSDRINRLEDVVQSIRDELDSVLPSIKNLSAIEGDIQELVGQLKAVVAAPPASVPVAPQALVSQGAGGKPEVSKENAAEKSPASVVVAPVVSGADIRAIRVAAHGNKTRVVFDSPAKTTYQVNYDEQENLVVVSTSAKSFSADLSRAARKSKVVRQVQSLKQDNGGMEFIFSLGPVSRFSQGSLLGPNKDNANYRYYFDIFH